MKYTIVRVCKLWYSVGIGMLYSEARVTRMESLTALSRTLVAPGSHFGALINELIVSCFVSSADTTRFQDTVQRIIKRCPSLSGLRIDPSFVPPEVAHIVSWSMDQQLRRMQFTYQLLDIVHLEWGSNLILEDLNEFLQHCPNLRSLWLNYAVDSIHVNPRFEKPICLPQLEELVVCPHIYAGMWLMPKLQRLTSPYCFSCTAHSLRYLHLTSLHDCRSLQLTLDECTSLEHLAFLPYNRSLSHIDGPAEICLLTHNSVKWIDLWVDLSDTRYNLMALINNPIRGLPALRRIRLLDSSLRHLSTMELPALLSPETAEAEDGCEYTYGGFEIKQTGHIVFKKDSPIQFENLLGIPPDEDEDEDDNYFDPFGSSTPYDYTSDPRSFFPGSSSSSSDRSRLIWR